MARHHSQRALGAVAGSHSLHGHVRPHLGAREGDGGGGGADTLHRVDGGVRAGGRSGTEDKFSQVSSLHIGALQ